MFLIILILIVLSIIVILLTSIIIISRSIFPHSFSNSKPPSISLHSLSLLTLRK
ncbi:hypothetical protein RchiOBHm_Chr6g0275651 [Rosa chinensis]|uniref:Uncharacterized protein n=1 Tax=Rosa chinensis TaxID=74649 RepID=A0A2P6PS17_ROSCH|nr:hypothetical protein RchiOBHm_Chr6g0275651 [Rosa chinensis]